MSRWTSARLLLAFASALCAGCPAATLEGKACPCTGDYFCCLTSQICYPTNQRARCTCPSVPLGSLSVTTNGAPLAGEPPPDAATDGQLIFGDPPERWASYPFKGEGEDLPIANVVPERNGFHLSFTFNMSVPRTNSYEGFGLSYDNTARCIDGTALQGVTFDVDGDPGIKSLSVAVTSANQVTPMDDRYRGLCDGAPSDCYGASVSRQPHFPETVTVLFSELGSGMAGTLSTGATAAAPGAAAVDGTKLDVTQIVNVQWMLNASDAPNADLTIRNVAFF